MLTEAGKRYMREHYPDRYGIDNAELAIDTPPPEEWGPPAEPPDPEPPDNGPPPYAAQVLTRSALRTLPDPEGSLGQPWPASPVHRADPYGRRPLSPRKSIVLNNGDGYFRYALNEKPSRSAFLKLYQQTPVRFWSKGV